MKEKTIELGKVRQGERFKLDGVEYIIVKQSDILATLE